MKVMESHGKAIYFLIIKGQIDKQSGLNFITNTHKHAFCPLLVMLKNMLNTRN